MITATASVPPVMTTTTVRVAVREIREATYRAVIAAGASAGEASTAAELTVHTEIHCGAGITAVLDELPRVPRRRVPMLRDPQHPDWLIDPAGRGPLLRMPTAADVAVAQREPLLLIETRWHPVITAAIHRSCLAHQVTLAAAEVTDTGAIGATAIGYPDGSMDWATGQPEATELLESIGYRPELDKDMAAGVLLIPADVDPTRTGSFSAEDLRRRTAAAFAGGVQVDSGPWSTLYAAAGLFLVPEQ